MEQNTIFSYHYSAAENEEIQAIRNKYLPQEESKMDELKRLDRYVQTAGIAESLAVGVGGCLLFGLGMCLAMKVIGDSMLLGVLIGLTGALGMIAAYPVHRRIYRKTKEKLTPRILELTNELI